MMTCREVAELLLDFVSDELTPEQVQALKQHLGVCPPCDALHATYRLTIHLSRRLPCHPLPSPCEQRLRAAVAQQWKQHGSSNV